jgi:hypothetical protein
LFFYRFFPMPPEHGPIVGVDPVVDVFKGRRKLTGFFSDYPTDFVGEATVLLFKSRFQLPIWVKRWDSLSIGS